MTFDKVCGVIGRLLLAVALLLAGIAYIRDEPGWRTALGYFLVIWSRDHWRLLLQPLQDRLQRWLGI